MALKVLSRKPYDWGVKDFSAVDHMIGNSFTSARISQIVIGKDCVVYKMSAVQKIMDFFNLMFPCIIIRCQ